MSTSHLTARRSERERREHANQLRQEMDRRGRRRRTSIRAVGTVAAVVVVAVVAAMMYTSRTTSSSAVRPAPPFTLTDTAGRRVSLADYRGHNVVIYFNEGAGCQSCLVQMAAIEKDAAAFKAADVTVLPVVMNTGEQISADMAANGVQTPFLLDDGTVSKAYGVLGKGMHAGLPGHSFVLVDTDGAQRWYGEYPSMWLEPGELLKQVKAHLAA